MCYAPRLQDDCGMDNKRDTNVTLKFTPEELERCARAAEMLYGKGHPVPRSTAIRQLAMQRADQILKKSRNSS